MKMLFPLVAATILTTIFEMSFSNRAVNMQKNPGDTIGVIDFYGYQNLDVAKVRAALPVLIGDQISEQTKRQIEAAVSGVTGKKPTQVARACCDEKGRSLIYIGLSGRTYKPFMLNPAPTGNEQLPAEILELENREEDASKAAIDRGQAMEDDSLGYSLSRDSVTKSFQLQERTWALVHGFELMRVLQFSSEAKQREVASAVLGYAQQSHEQITALVSASRDPDWLVRNNATRALGVLAGANPKLAEEIEPQTFLDMLFSGTWTDRNKAVWLLDPMSMTRNPKLLTNIGKQALEPLIEMALWSNTGHAIGARTVLGRIGGILEDRLNTIAWKGPVDEIIMAARKAVNSEDMNRR